jgi:hypothetical protein
MFWVRITFQTCWYSSLTCNWKVLGSNPRQTLATLTEGFVVINTSSQVKWEKSGPRMLPSTPSQFIIHTHLAVPHMMLYNLSGWYSQYVHLPLDPQKNKRWLPVTALYYCAVMQCLLHDDITLSYASQCAFLTLEGQDKYLGGWQWCSKQWQLSRCGWVFICWQSCLLFLFWGDILGCQTSCAMEWSWP